MIYSTRSFVTGEVDNAPNENYCNTVCSSGLLFSTSCVTHPFYLLVIGANPSDGCFSAFVFYAEDLLLLTELITFITKLTTTLVKVALLKVVNKTFHMCIATFGL